VLLIYPMRNTSLCAFGRDVEEGMLRIISIRTVAAPCSLTNGQPNRSKVKLTNEDRSCPPPPPSRASGQANVREVLQMAAAGVRRLLGFGGVAESTYWQHGRPAIGSTPKNEEGPLALGSSSLRYN
jgi:hypothetical protein